MREGDRKENKKLLSAHNKIDQLVRLVRKLTIKEEEHKKDKGKSNEDNLSSLPQLKNVNLEEKFHQPITDELSKIDESNHDEYGL